MKVSYNQVGEESRLQEITLWQPVIDHELSRQYTKTWAAMENLVDSGTTKLIGTNIRKIDACIVNGH
jgi:hypothetical protein